MSVTLLAIVSALFFAITFLLRKQAIRFIPFELAFLIESIIYLVAPLIMFMVLPSAVKKAALNNTGGMLFAFLTGIFVVGGVALSYMALKDGFLSKVISITSPAQILFGVVLGILFFSENLTYIQIIGVVFSIVGVILLAK